ncbi:MAG: 2-dehydropantoate 2-reductase [Candidatus Pelagadaptatus aseana]|uniref:2-dehydropantoate 2-reductase n=1 Tax=Candidatus Pelagadaptatus aseana TaxID=3120508 RepID=UPI0039B30249
MSLHTVFGAGLIGGYVGGLLRSQGFDVSIVGRERLRERFSGRLKLTDFHGNEAFAEGFEFSVQPQTTTDFLWLTVKCTAVEAVIEDICPLVGPDTIILCCQNGLGSDAAVRQAFSSNTVLRVMVQFNVADMAPNHLHRGSEGDVTVEHHPRLEAIVEQLNCGLMPVHLSRDMDAVLWAKLQLNLANAINALADIPVKSMLQKRGYRRVIARLMAELLAVTRAKDLVLPKLTGLPAQKIPGFLNIPDWLFKILGSKMLEIDPTVRTSMWWDLSNNKLTEVDHLNGAVVNAAEELGVPCPANRKIVELVHQVERGELAQGVSAKDLLSALD